jgi:hypothetical protein
MTNPKTNIKTNTGNKTDAQPLESFAQQSAALVPLTAQHQRACIDARRSAWCMGCSDAWRDLQVYKPTLIVVGVFYIYVYEIMYSECCFSRSLGLSLIFDFFVAVVALLFQYRLAKTGSSQN